MNSLAYCFIAGVSIAILTPHNVLGNAIEFYEEEFVDFATFRRDASVSCMASYVILPEDEGLSTWQREYVRINRDDKCDTVDDCGADYCHQFAKFDDKPMAANCRYNRCRCKVVASDLHSGGNCFPEVHKKKETRQKRYSYNQLSEKIESVLRAEGVQCTESPVTDRKDMNGVFFHTRNGCNNVSDCAADQCNVVPAEFQIANKDLELMCVRHSYSLEKRCTCSLTNGTTCPSYREGYEKMSSW